MKTREQNIVILTGSGISAESGIATFRDSGGLWENHKIEDVATPEGFAKNPKLVQSFYNARRQRLNEVQPNAAHFALAELEKNWQGRFLLVTQNVDDLHGRAGSGSYIKDSLIHMHGELLKSRCLVTEEIYNQGNSIEDETLCLCCGKNNLRPHIVWFGEMPLDMETIYDHLHDADIFLSIGTSGSVYPAAGFVDEVSMGAPCRTVEINLEPSSGYSRFHEKIYGPASKTVPAFVEELLS